MKNIFRIVEKCIIGCNNHDKNYVGWLFNSHGHDEVMTMIDKSLGPEIISYFFEYSQVRLHRQINTPGPFDNPVRALVCLFVCLLGKTYTL